VWRAVCCARVRVGGLGPQELAAVEALDGRGRFFSLKCSPQMRPLVGESQSSRTLVRSGSAQGLLVGKAVMMKLECFISFTPKKCWLLQVKLVPSCFRGDFPARFISCRSHWPPDFHGEVCMGSKARREMSAGRGLVPRSASSSSPVRVLPPSASPGAPFTLRSMSPQFGIFRSPRP